MIALVTGASSGFGQAISELLIANGYQVIGTGRRKQKLLTLQEKLGDNFHPLAFDLQDKAETLCALEKLPKRWQNIDILVNNAGLALGLTPAYEADIEDWEQMIATNISGLTRLTRTLLPNMVTRKCGHIINIGSIAGTYPYPGANVYGATKAFVKQFSLNLRADLAGTHIRVSNIEPGLCSGTEFSSIRFHGNETAAAAVYKDKLSLVAEDIARTTLWIMKQPAHMNVNSIEIMPTSQSFGALPVQPID
ncbi:UNVERIFIED_CONTAM: hypothetical protein GTU68_060404 [Idotea baltica]|nr:hypothetical protein [Idotea baltica]